MLCNTLADTNRHTGSALAKRYTIAATTDGRTASADGHTAAANRYAATTTDAHAAIDCDVHGDANGVADDAHRRFLVYSATGRNTAVDR
jgi:hypothetical protein